MRKRHAQGKVNIVRKLFTTFSLLSVSQSPQLGFEVKNYAGWKVPERSHQAYPRLVKCCIWLLRHISVTISVHIIYLLDTYLPHFCWFQSFVYCFAHARRQAVCINTFYHIIFEVRMQTKTNSIHVLSTFFSLKWPQIGLDDIGYYQNA